MNELQVFTNPEFGTVRTLLIGEEPWAVGKDVAAALGYSNTQKALRDHVDPEDRMGERNVTPSIKDDKGRTQYPTWINESGLYSLILSSKLPSAKRFKRWVTSEVLPTLRRSGQYSTTSERLLTCDDYLTAARILSVCRNERLPYVLPLIKKAGIDIDVLSLPGGKRYDAQTARLLYDAWNTYGLSFRELERKTGIHTAQLYRMKNGTSLYNEARAAIIREAIHALLPELDVDAYYRVCE